MKKCQKFKYSKNENFLVETNFCEKRKNIEKIAFLAENNETLHKNTFTHVIRS